MTCSFSTKEGLKDMFDKLMGADQMLTSDRKYKLRILEMGHAGPRSCTDRFLLPLEYIGCSAGHGSSIPNAFLTTDSDGKF